MYSTNFGRGYGFFTFCGEPSISTNGTKSSGWNPAPRMFIPPNDKPDDLEEDAAGRKIVVVVVGRATAAAPIFVRGGDRVLRRRRSSCVSPRTRGSPRVALRAGRRRRSSRAPPCASRSPSPPPPPPPSPSPSPPPPPSPRRPSAWDSADEGFPRISGSSRLVFHGSSARSAAFSQPLRLCHAPLLASGTGGGAPGDGNRLPEPRIWSTSSDMGILGGSSAFSRSGTTCTPSCARLEPRLEDVEAVFGDELAKKLFARLENHANHQRPLRVVHHVLHYPRASAILSAPA